MGRQMQALERQAALVQSELEQELASLRRSMKRELVRYEAPGMALVPAAPPTRRQQR